jgi:hypothetical protein
VKSYGKTGVTLLLLASVLLLLTTVGCASQMRGAPVEPGEIAIDLAFSGPIAQMNGVYPIPYPTIGVRYGVLERLQVGISYVPVLHVIRPLVGFQILEGGSEGDPLIPSIYLAIEAGFRTNFTHTIFYPRLDLAAMWNLEPISPYVEFGVFSDSESLTNGEFPLMSVTIGANWQILPWLDMNAGLLYWGMNKDYGYSTTSGDASGTPWVLTPGGMGAIGLTFGFGIIFEDKK